MKVLLVDDSPTILSVYSNKLQQHGYQVLTAETVDEAFALAQEHRPEIGIIDFYMPDSNGDILVRKLLQHADTRGMVCAIFSQHPEVIQKALAAGAIELISKDDPFEIFILRVNAMQRLVSSWSMQREISDLVLAGTQSEENFRILFVDDSTTVREVYYNLLSNHGYEVTLAEDKRSALKMVQQSRPHLAILDYHLPDGTGIELAREIHQLEGADDPLILIYTSRSESRAVQRSGLDILYKEDSDDLIVHRLESIKRYVLAEGQMIHASRLTALGEMSSMIAHELNQPMMVISTILERIQRLSSTADFTPQQLQKPLQQASDALQKANQTIRHMRSYSYQDDEIPHPHWVEPVPLIQRSLQFFHAICQQRGVTLTIELKEGRGQIWGEERQLEQLITNLINNALHAIAERKAAQQGHEGSIRVQFLQGTTLTIEDNGVGMDEEQRQRCMEPFYTTRDIGDGTGLGLFVVKGIARRFQASLSFESEKFHNTRAIIRFKAQE